MWQQIICRSHSSSFQYLKEKCFFSRHKHTSTWLMHEIHNGNTVQSWQLKQKDKTSQFVTVRDYICSVNFQTSNLKNEKHFKYILHSYYQSLLHSYLFQFPGKLHSNLHKTKHETEELKKEKPKRYKACMNEG